MNDSDDFDYEQFLLAVQVQKCYYRGFYPFGILVVWTLLRADCYDLSGCDNYGNPPIIYASKSGSVVLLRLLLHYKADINALSKLRETALIVACRNMRMKAIKFLLNRGAQTDLVDRSGYSALRWAVTHEHVDMVHLLLKCNASVTKDCYTAGSALDIARKGTSERHSIILKALEEKLVAEREALLLQIVEMKKKDAIEELEEYRHAKQEAEAAKKAAEAAAQLTLKSAKQPWRAEQRKILVGAKARRAVEESIGTRVPTPVERVVGKSLEDSGESLSGAWVRVGGGKWQTRDHLQQTGTLVYSAATVTLVESFAAGKKAARELLTSDGKWQVFLGQQLHSRATKSRESQGQLTIEDLE